MILCSFDDLTNNRIWYGDLILLVNGAPMCEKDSWKDYTAHYKNCITTGVVRTSGAV